MHPPETNTHNGPRKPTDDSPRGPGGECASPPPVSRERIEWAREALIALLDAESLKVCMKLVSVIKAGQEEERREKQSRRSKAGRRVLETLAAQAQAKEPEGNGRAPRRETKNRNPKRGTPCGNQDLPTIQEEDPSELPNVD